MFPCKAPWAADFSKAGPAFVRMVLLAGGPHSAWSSTEEWSQTPALVIMRPDIDKIHWGFQKKHWKAVTPSRPSILRSSNVSVKDSATFFF